MQGVYVFEPGREERERKKKKKKESCVLYIFPWYILCMLVKASTAWTLSNVGYARTVLVMGCHFKLSPASPQWEILRRAVSTGSNFAGGSMWPRAANTRAAVLASSRTSNQHWTHFLQRHKPHAILLLVSFAWTFPLLLRLFQLRI